jgi:hypothetical protein
MIRIRRVRLIIYGRQEHLVSMEKYETSEEE